MTKHPETNTAREASRVANALLASPFVRSFWISASLLGSGCADAPNDADPATASEPESASVTSARATGALTAVISAPASSTGDPVRGRQVILNGGYMSCGIPLKLMGNPLLSSLLPFSMSNRSESPVEGREGLNATLPIGMTMSRTPDGAEIVHQNCMQCHAGKFDGELLVGLPNVVADGTGPGDGASSSGPAASQMSDALLSQLGLSDPELRSFKKMLRGLNAVRAGLRPARAVGQNSAWTSSAILVAHHDPATSEWRDQPATPFEFVDADGRPIPDARLASDPPPWWRLKKKHSIYTNGMGRGDHSGQLAIATLICVDNRPEAERVEALFKDVQAYLESIPAPVYKRKIDRALAANGKKLFEKTCSGCHGTYAPEPMDDANDTYPNLLVALELVGTDPVVADMSTHLKDFIAGFNASFQAQSGSLQPDTPFRGYTAPPLDGVWATAPYLHNGSIPTLDVLLNSKARPPVWKRVDLDDTNFDEAAVGWPWMAPPYSQSDAPEEERKFIYDTSYWSQSNAGHTFGDVLDDDERRAHRVREDAVTRCWRGFMAALLDHADRFRRSSAMPSNTLAVSQETYPIAP